jgi:hypothetical protein
MSLSEESLLGRLYMSASAIGGSAFGGRGRSAFGGKEVRKLIVIICFAALFGCMNSSNRESGSRLKAFKGSNETPHPVGYGDKDKGDKGDDNNRRGGNSFHHSEHQGWNNNTYEEDDDDSYLDINLAMDFLFYDRISYNKYPYAYNDPIYQKDKDSPGRPMAGTFKSYYIRVDNDIWAYHLDEEIKFSTGISEELSYTKYIEDVPNKSKNDEMGCFKCYFNWLGAENTNAIVKIGVGGEHISGIGGGASFQGAVDLFPEKPWGLSGAVSYSFLGNNVRIADLEFKLGLFKRCNEFDVGYRLLMNSHGDNLNGPFIGVALWF